MPIRAAGIMEITIFRENLVSSFHWKENRPRKISNTSFLNTTKVLRAVAKCRTTVNKRLSWGRASAPNNAFPISRCPLEETGRNSVNPWTMPRIMASMSSKSVLVFVRVQQYGIYLDAQADKDQGRGQANPSEVVDLGIEDIGIVAPPAAHKDKTQDDTGDSYKKEAVVFLLEKIGRASCRERV